MTLTNLIWSRGSKLHLISQEVIHFEGIPGYHIFFSQTQVSDVVYYIYYDSVTHHIPLSHSKSLMYHQDLTEGKSPLRPQEGLRHSLPQLQVVEAEYQLHTLREALTEKALVDSSESTVHGDRNIIQRVSFNIRSLVSGGDDDYDDDDVLIQSL